LKILIADDSEFIRQRIADMLSEIEDVIIVGQACEGQEALDLFYKTKPDIVILDIRMPKRSGIEVLSEIKKDQCRPVVIILTNYPHEQYRLRCMEAGTDYFFDKSSEFEKVLDVLREYRNNDFSHEVLLNG
jgi:DNA-binding NarL/FixJ family response regulator